MSNTKEYTLILDQFRGKRAVLSSSIVNDQIREIVWFDIEVLKEISVEFEIISFNALKCEYKIEFKEKEKEKEIYKRIFELKFLYPISGELTKEKVEKEIFNSIDLNSILWNYDLWDLFLNKNN